MPRTRKLAPHDFWDLAHELTSAGHRIQFKATGNSMTPNIKSGTLLTLQSPSRRVPPKGALLFCRTWSNRLVAHRLAGIMKKDGKTILRLRGDSGRGKEEWADATDALEIVTRCTPSSARSALFRSWLILRTRTALHLLRKASRKLSLTKPRTKQDRKKRIIQ